MTLYLSFKAMAFSKSQKKRQNRFYGALQSRLINLIITFPTFLNSIETRPHLRGVVHMKSVKKESGNPSLAYFMFCIRNIWMAPYFSLFFYSDNFSDSSPICFTLEVMSHYLLLTFRCYSCLK